MLRRMNLTFWPLMLSLLQRSFFGLSDLILKHPASRRKALVAKFIPIHRCTIVFYLVKQDIMFHNIFII